MHARMYASKLNGVVWCGVVGWGGGLMCGGATGITGACGARRRHKPEQGAARRQHEPSGILPVT